MAKIESFKFLITITYIFVIFSVALVIVNNRFIERFNDCFVDEEKRI